MDSYRGWVDPLLRAAYARAENEKDARKRLNASLALLPVDSGQTEYLYGRMLQAEPEELTAIREALLVHKQNFTERLWALLENRQNDQDARIRAACAGNGFRPRRPTQLRKESRWGCGGNAGDSETVCDCPMDGCLEGKAHRAVG